MRVAFCYAPELLNNRPLDFGNLWSSPRGMTGSESSLVIFARELALLKHDVTLFVPGPNADSFDGVQLRHLEGVPTAELSQFDCVISFIYSRFLAGLPESILRVNLQTCNSHDYEHENFEDSVDLFLSPSDAHRRFMAKWTLTAQEKWRTLRLGCYIADYLDTPKVPGSVVFTSSADRGLHLVLSEWPEIKKAVPHATLRIFYHGLKEYISYSTQIQPDEGRPADQIAHGFRARTIEAGLKLPGVEYVGVVSREQMARELCQAEVLAYPCETALWSEGFSCSTLEGCAAGALPILARCDALGEVYDDVIPMVDHPASENMEEWRHLVILALTDESSWKSWVSSARAFAEKHDCRDIAKDLEAELFAAIERKKSPVTAQTPYARWVLSGTGAVDPPVRPYQPIPGRVVVPPGYGERMKELWLKVLLRAQGTLVEATIQNFLHECASACCVAVPALSTQGKVPDFGYPIMQAMRCGAPVVMERTPCFQWLDGTNLFADGPEEFVDLIVKTVNSRQLQFQQSIRGEMLARRYTPERRKIVLSQLRKR